MESHESSGGLRLFVDAAHPVGRPSGPAFFVRVADGIVLAVRLLRLGDHVLDVGPFAIPEISVG